MAEIKGDGLSQADLVTFLGNVVSLVNELSASIKSLTAQLDLDATVTDETYAANNDPTGSDLSLTV